MPVDEEAMLKVECRRSLYEHARDARRRGWSAAEWEEWAEEHGSALVAKLGRKEVDAIVRHIWRL